MIPRAIAVGELFPHWTRCLRNSVVIKRHKGFAGTTPLKHVNLVFCTATGEPLLPRTVPANFDRVLRLAGLSQQIQCKDLRSFTAHTMEKVGVPQKMTIRQPRRWSSVLSSKRCGITWWLLQDQKLVRSVRCGTVATDGVFLQHLIW